MSEAIDRDPGAEVIASIAITTSLSKQTTASSDLAHRRVSAEYDCSTIFVAYNVRLNSRRDAGRSSPLSLSLSVLLFRPIEPILLRLSGTLTDVLLSSLMRGTLGRLVVREEDNVLLFWALSFKTAPPLGPRIRISAWSKSRNISSLG